MGALTAAVTLAKKPKPVESWPVLLHRLIDFTVLLLTGMAVFLLLRRLSGDLVRPLSSSTLGFIALLLISFVNSLRWTRLLLSVRICSDYSQIMIFALTCACVLVIGAALSLPGTSNSVLTAFWLFIVSEELLSGLQFFKYLKRNQIQTEQNEFPPISVGSPITESNYSSEIAEKLADELEISQLSKGITQQLTRELKEDGTDTFWGNLRGFFEPKQRTLSLHISFCPPFLTTPHLAVEQTSGPTVTVDNSQLFPYGARLDLRMQRSCVEKEAVLLQFRAWAPAEEQISNGEEDSSDPPESVE